MQLKYRKKHVINLHITLKQVSINSFSQTYLYAVPKKIHLPLTPNVVSRDNSLFICFQDGSEIYWGQENSTIEALDLARELEIELRAVSYLKKQISDFVKDMDELLYSINADESLLLSIIKDGHAQALDEIGQDKCRKLLLDRKPELKEKILGKISSSFVV